jgi:lysophospholipase L1-like esterase
MSNLLPGMHLLVVGDSITLGAAEVRGNTIVSPAGRTYLDVLGDLAPGLRLTANAQLHRTTTDALRLLDAQVAEHNPDVVLLMLGGNDVDVNWKRFVITEGRANGSVIPLEVYGQNLRQMIRILREAGILPLITDLPRHDLVIRGRYLSEYCGRDVSAMLDRVDGHTLSRQRLSSYCRMAEEISAETGCPIVRYGAALARHPRSEMLGPDGAHPTAQAHEIIGQTIYAALLANVPRHRLETMQQPLSQQLT